MVVFDRGLQHRHTLCALAERGLLFVTRLKTDARFDVLGRTPLTAPDPLASVFIERDERG